VNEVVAMGKAVLAAFLAALGFWHLFGPAVSKRLANDGHSHQRRRRRAEAQNDPMRNVRIDPR